MSIEGVAERGAPCVVHDHRQVVFGGHTWTEYILVTVVAVVRLVVEVERLQPRVVPEVQFPRTVDALMCALLGVGCHPACGSVLRSGKPHSAAGVHLLGRVAEPPVHKIEVVRRLVNQQAAGVGLVAVPTAEVVRAVGCVEYPFERDDSGVPIDPFLITSLSAEFRGE